MDIIDHIGIRVDDLKEAESWYLGRLKAEVTFRSDKYIRLKVGNTNIALIDGTIGVYVEDPFGNYLEYIWYAPEHEETFLK